MTEPSPPDKAGTAGHAEASPDAVSISSQQYLEYLSLRAAQMADDRARQREERRAKTLTLAVAIFGVAGVTATVNLVNNAVHTEIGNRTQDIQKATDTKTDALNKQVADKLAQFTDQLNLAQRKVEMRLDATTEHIAGALASENKEIADLGPELDRKIKANTESIVDPQVKGMNDSLRTEINYQTLARLAQALDLKSEYSPAERDDAVRVLRQLKDTTVVSRPDFVQFLERIVHRLHLSRQTEALDEIDSFLGDVIARDQGMTRVMIEEYGLQVIGSHRSLAEDAALVARFQHYLGKAASVGSPELEYLWGMLLDARRAEGGELHPRPELAGSMRYLAQNDARFLLMKLVEFAVPECYMHEPRFESDQLARYATVVRKTYAAPIKGIIERMGAEVYAEGVRGLIAQMSSGKELDDAIKTRIVHVAAEMAVGSESPVAEPKPASGG